MVLVVTGTVGLDTVHAPAGRVEGVLGGSGAYFAAAASFHTPVGLVAAAGGDWPPDHRRIIESFDNVSLEGLEVRPESRTFAWGARYLDDLNRRETLFTELGVLEEEGPAVPESYRNAEFVFLGNAAPAEQLRLLEQFPNRKLVVADTMDLWINVAHPELLALLERVDGIVLNDEEAELLTGIGNAVSAGRAILEMYPDGGPSFAVVKKGEHGCLLVSGDQVATLPAFPADRHQVVDPTGAGDSFGGGFMGHLASIGMTDFRSMQTALAWGTVTASFAIESFSLDRLTRLTRAEIDERMKAFQAAARVG